MIGMPNLKTALLDLLYELQGSTVRLIIGGGFGIFLREAEVRKSGRRTVLREWPEPRSTNDLDLFLRPELIIESAKLKPLQSALKTLGYETVRGAEKYQFIMSRVGDSGVGDIKIDILTGPRACSQGTRVKTDKRRAKPSPSVGIHAHPVEEAITLERELHSKALTGCLSSGEEWTGEVFLLHAYTFLMMKLFAFRDRLDDSNKEFGRYHALDIYTILATTTENEWRKSLELSDELRDQPYVIEATNLVYKFFSSADRLGVIRLKESPYWRSDLELDEFISALQELFPSTIQTVG